MDYVYASLLGILSEMDRIEEASALAPEALLAMRRARQYYVEHWAYFYWRRGQNDVAARLIGVRDATREASIALQTNERRLYSRARAGLEAELPRDGLCGRPRVARHHDGAAGGRRQTQLGQTSGGDRLGCTLGCRLCDPARTQPAHRRRLPLAVEEDHSTVLVNGEVVRDTGGRSDRLDVAVGRHRDHSRPSSSDDPVRGQDAGRDLALGLDRLRQRARSGVERDEARGVRLLPTRDREQGVLAVPAGRAVVLECAQDGNVGDRAGRQVDDGRETAPEEELVVVREAPRRVGHDEPLSALDAVVRVTLRDEIRRIQTTLGITTLYVTHDQEEALAISDRVVVMRDGWVEQVGTPETVYAEPATRFVATFIGKINQLDGIVECAVKGRVRWGDHLVTVPPAATAGLVDGKVVVVLVRPEAVAVVPAGADGSPGENRVPATIQLVTFLGPVIRLSLEAGGRQFLVDVTTGDRCRFQRGAPVRLVFPAAACRVLGDESAGGRR